jgi:hypothetical protein
LFHLLRAARQIESVTMLICRVKQWFCGVGF